MLGPKNLRFEKNGVPNKYLVQNNVWSKEIFGSTKFWVKKNILSQQKIWFQKIMDPKKFHGPTKHPKFVLKYSSSSFDIVVKTPTQLQHNLNPTILGVWTRKWLCKPHHRNSMSVISQLLLTRFWPTFKERFLGLSWTDLNCCSKGSRQN